MSLKKESCVMCQALQQEKHVLQRKMDVNELAFSQREAELVADLAASQAELERHHAQGRDRRRDESGQMTQLANHNQRLVEQLSEVSLSDGAEDMFARVRRHKNAAEPVLTSPPCQPLHNVLSQLFIFHSCRPSRWNTP